MSNADQLRYLKMEEQIASMSKEPRTFQYPFGTMPILDGSPSPTLKVNNKGELIFDETSLGLLDEHIRKVVREEWKKIQQEIVMQFRGGRI
jgi:hypothetical protein